MSNPISADTTRVVFVPETTAGVTPANPNMLVARITSEGITFNPSTTLSNEFNAQRQVTDVIVSGGSTGGDLGFELSRNPWFEEMLAGVFGNEWGATFPDRLEVGVKLKTYTIEKTFAACAEVPADPGADPPEPGRPAEFDYHRVVRAMIDAMTLTFTPAAAATGSITILGGTFTRSHDELAGATYEEPGLRPVILGADVIPVVFRIGGVDYTAWCLSQIVVNFNNNGRAIECLGTIGAAEMMLGRFECTVTMTVYASCDTHAILDAFLAIPIAGQSYRTEIAMAFRAQDGFGNFYFFEFDRCRIQAATQVAGGTNQDVVIALTLQALMGPTGTPPLPTVQSCATVYRQPALPLDAPEGLMATPLTRGGGTAFGLYNEYGNLSGAQLDKLRSEIKPAAPTGNPGGPIPTATPPRHPHKKKVAEPQEA